MEVKLCMANYNRRQYEQITYDRLMEKGYLISRSSNDVPKYSIHEEEIQKGKQLLHSIVDRPGRALGTPPPPFEVRESSSGGPCR